MPGMRGRELAERLAAARPSMKVLYTSGDAYDALVRQGVLNAGVPFLQQPFKPETLAQKVRAVLPPGRIGTVSADLATFAKKLIVAESLERGARIPGKLDLSGSTIGELAVSVSSFKEEVPVENLKLHGILLRQAQINKFSAIGSKGGYPQPIDLSFSEIKWWEFQGGKEAKSEDADDYLQLLRGDPHPQRHTFSSIEQNLFNRGLDDEADEVHRAMREWMRRKDAGKFGRRLWSVSDFFTLSTPWRLIRRVPIWTFIWLRNRFRSSWDFFTHSTTNPLPLLGIVVIWTLFSAICVFSNPANIGPSEVGLTAHPKWRADSFPPDAEWGWRSGVWMALRFHVPVAVLTARSAWAPANGREFTVSVPYLPKKWKWLSPEDYANLVLAFSCLFWPVILIITSRKFFMRLGK